MNIPQQIKEIKQPLKDLKSRGSNKALEEFNALKAMSLASNSRVNESISSPKTNEDFDNKSDNLKVTQVTKIVKIKKNPEEWIKIIIKECQKRKVRVKIIRLTKSDLAWLNEKKKKNDKLRSAGEACESASTASVASEASNLTSVSSVNAKTVAQVHEVERKPSESPKQKGKTFIMVAMKPSDFRRTSFDYMQCWKYSGDLADFDNQLEPMESAAASPPSKSSFETFDEDKDDRLKCCCF